MTDKSLSSDECARLRQAWAEGIASDDAALLDFAELKAEARRRLAIERGRADARSGRVASHDETLYHKIIDIVADCAWNLFMWLATGIGRLA